MVTAAKGVLFFAISALLGWVLESIASSCLALRPVNSGFLRGAYIPAYGVCVFAALTAKALIPIGLGLPLQIGFVFAVSALTKAGYRLVAASLARSIYQVSLWDDDLLYYSDQDGDRAGHFTGRAARLLWLISGGLYGILMAVILHPYIAGFISRLGALPAGLLSSAFVVYLVLDLRQSLKEASILSKTMSELENLGLMLYKECREEQAQYDIKLGEYDDKAQLHRQEWRHRLDEINDGSGGEAQAGMEARFGDIERANQGLQQALRRLKEEMMEISSSKYVILDAFYALYDTEIGRVTEAMAADGRLRDMRRLLRAFPGMAPTESRFAAMTGEADEAGYRALMQYLWREVRMRARAC